MSESWNSLKLIQWTSEYFEKQGIPNPRVDAELLLAHVLKAKRIDLYTGFELTVSEKKLAQFKEMVKRRATREPLQYIIGETEFWGLTIKVTPDVLIPRPETEMLVEEAIKAHSSRLVARGQYTTSNELPTTSILDIGTGSGCIAIALAKHLTEASVIATDFSKEALALATENVRAHQLRDRIKLVLADIAPWRTFVAAEQKFDLILSNPPYICSDEFPTLQPEVRDFEPRRALDGGNDGLDFYRRITQDVADFLKPDGAILLEVGDTQAALVSGLLQKVGLLGTIHKDLAGMERIVRGVWKK